MSILQIMCSLNSGIKCFDESYLKLRRIIFLKILSLPDVNEVY